jgi:hypothetical protein
VVGVLEMIRYPVAGDQEEFLKPPGFSGYRITTAMGILQRLRALAERLQRAFHRSPPAFRRVLAMLVDALIVMESFALALIVRASGDAVAPSWPYFWPFAIFSALACVLLLNWNGVYRSVVSSGEIRQQGLYLDVRLLSASAMAAGGLFLAVFSVGPFGFGITRVNIVPLSVPLMGSVLAYVQLAWVRLAWVKLYPQT